MDLDVNTDTSSGTSSGPDVSSAPPEAQPRTPGWLAFALGRRTAWIVALVTVMLAVAAIALVGQGERTRLATDQLPAGFDSTAAAALAERLPESGESTAIVLFTAENDTDPLPATALGRLAGLLEEVTGEPPVLIPAPDGTAALAVVQVASGSATEVAASVTELRDRLNAGEPDGVMARVTGPAGIEADLAAVFEGANFRLLAATALVVAVLLVATYRSPVLWLIPLTVVGLADQVAAVAATRVLAAFDLAWNESTVGILSVLVFGAGTNYALLLISRYRDELRGTADRFAAMRAAVHRSVEPVTFAAGTVVVGLLVLLASLVPTTRGLGLACAIGVLVAATFALVVLPSVLVLVGRWVFWPRVPRVGEAALADQRSVWRRVGDAVARRPVAVVAIVLVALAVLATGVPRIQLGLDSSEKFLRTPEAIVAAERIAVSFPAGTANPTLVLTTADPARVQAAAAAVDGVASVRPGESGDGVTQLTVVLTAGEGTVEAEQAISELRAAVSDLPETHVGGPEATAMDARDGAARDRQLLIPVILALVVGLLGLLLRSVVAPIVLVATVVCTYLAALGAAWWVFSGLLGFSALDDGVPLLAFLFLVALGVDYNIFLVTRGIEEAREVGTRAGILRALGATGGVITSAGILLASVFAVLGVLPLVVLAQLGVVIFIGVLLDTLVVRTLLVPALVLLMGERFWWPRALS